GIPETEPLIGGAGAFGPVQAGGRGGAGGGGGRVGGAVGVAGGAGRGAVAGAPAAAGAPAGPPGLPGGAPAVITPGRGGPGGGGGGGRGVPEGAVFVGDKGFLSTDTYGASVRLLPQARHDAYRLPPEVLTRSPGHYQDWIRACKGGDPACSNFSMAGPFTEWVVMGVIAVRVEGKLEWNSAQLKFTNSAE